MKHLVVTFALAVAIICAAVYFGKGAEPAAANGKLAKTLVTLDPQGRVLQELTYVLKNNTWEESAKKAYTYKADGDRLICTETSYARCESGWNPDEQRVRVYNGDALLEEDIYAPSSDGWERKVAMNLSDLDEDAVVEDLLFDKDGHLLMEARYADVNGQLRGIEKTESRYANGALCKRLTYRWNSTGWSVCQEQCLQFVK